MKARQVSVLPTSTEATALATERMAAHGKVETVGAFLVGRAADADIDAMQVGGSVVEVVPERSDIGWLEPDKQPAAPVPLAEGASNPALAALADAAPKVYVVQFAGPLRPAWRMEVEAKGVQLGAHVPRFAYKASLMQEQKAALELLPSVRRIVEFGPEQTLRRAVLVEAQPKRSPGAQPPAKDADAQAAALAPARGEATQPTVQTAMPADPPIYDVKCHNAADLPDIEAVLAKDGRIARVDRGRNRLRVRVQDEAAANPLVLEIAKLPQVSVIERYQIPSIETVFVRKAIAAPDPDPTRRGATAGEGELVGVADTGVDRDHPDLAGRVVEVRSWAQASDPHDAVGHGTHVCGIICGDGTASGGAITGVAPQARLFVQALADDAGRLTGIPVDLNTLFKEAYDAGVRIHNNSWGVVVNGLYTIDAYEVDQFAHEHPDCLIIIAAGNTGKQGSAEEDPEGRIGLNSLQSPAASKNALTVGACCSPRSDGPYSGKTWRDWRGKFSNGPERPLAADETICGDADVIAAFSSRGPTDESRIKPDLVAPGTVVVSAASSASSPIFPYETFDGKYCYMSGTSMAAPAVAGAAALIRRWYIEERGTTPSAALLKATLINGCAWIDRKAVTDPNIGQPNFHQGFGRLDLLRTVPFSEGDLKLAFADIASESAEALKDDRPDHATWRRRLTVTKAGDLSVTLVWSDPPGHGLQHNLNLITVAPDKKITTGNVDLMRAPFERLDRTNNIEQVKIAGAAPGDYVVQISAQNTLFGKQGFAVVATGPIESDLL